MLYESLNEIKVHQFQIANFFRNPVNEVNFGVNYHKKDKNKDNLLGLDDKKLSLELLNADNEDYSKVAQSDLINEDLSSQSQSTSIIRKRKSREMTKIQTNKIDDPSALINKTRNESSVKRDLKEQKSSLFRLLFHFSAFHWNDQVEVPNEELYLVFNFIGKLYKVSLGKHYENLKYFDINFFKIFYIITDEKTGFIDYVDMNKVKII